MRGDFGVIVYLKRVLEILHRFGVVAQAVLQPPHAVHDEGIVRLERHGLLQECQGFLVARGAVSERITECIERVHVLRILFEDLAQIVFGYIEHVEFLRYERTRIEQILVARNRLERGIHHVERLAILLGLAQDLLLGQRQLHAFPVVLRLDAFQVTARTGEISLSGQHRAETKLGFKIIFAVPDFTIPVCGIVVAFALFRHLAQIKTHLIVLRTQFQGAFQVFPGLVQVIGLQ